MELGESIERLQTMTDAQKQRAAHQHCLLQQFKEYCNSQQTDDDIENVTIITIKIIYLFYIEYLILFIYFFKNSC